MSLRRIITSSTRLALSGISGKESGVMGMKIVLEPAKGDYPYRIDILHKTLENDRYRFIANSLRKLTISIIAPFTAVFRTSAGTMYQHRIRRKVVVDERYEVTATRDNHQCSICPSIIRSLPTLLSHSTNYLTDNPKVISVDCKLSYEKERGNILEISRMFEDGSSEVTHDIDYTTLMLLRGRKILRDDNTTATYSDYFPLRSGNTTPMLENWLGGYPWKDTIELTIRRESCI